MGAAVPPLGPEAPYPRLVTALTSDVTVYRHMNPLRHFRGRVRRKLGVTVLAKD